MRQVPFSLQTSPHMTGLLVINLPPLIFLCLIWIRPGHFHHIHLRPHSSIRCFLPNTLPRLRGHGHDLCMMYVCWGPEFYYLNLHHQGRQDFRHPLKPNLLCICAVSSGLLSSQGVNIVIHNLYVKSYCLNCIYCMPRHVQRIIQEGSEANLREW